ncbi:TPA: LOW QUALITY PROTEIN: hypothetical protein N0F65_005710, partial [Lagenidium giganteum]
CLQLESAVPSQIDVMGKARGRPSGRSDIASNEHMQIIGFLRAHLKPNGVLSHDAVERAAETFGCDCNKAIWKRQQHGVQPKRGGLITKYDAEELKQAVVSVPIHERMAVRATAAAICMSSSKLQTYISAPAASSSGAMSTHRSPISIVLICPIGLRKRYFNPMYNISEFILTEDEDIPHITCPKKRYITKVMLLTAVTRPRYDYKCQRGFDGKIGIFPIVSERIAQRTTKIQTKRDTVTVPASVDKKVYYELLTEEVLPDQGQVAWKKAIHIQQDNASPHISAKQAIMNAGLADEDWTMKIRRHPAKSPDLTSWTWAFSTPFITPRGLDYLIAAVNSAVVEMEVYTLEKCLLTLQAVMEQVMLTNGSNNYDLPRAKALHFPDGNFPHAKDDAVRGMGSERDLTDDERLQAVIFMPQNAREGQLQHGAIAQAAAKFRCHRNTINRIWKRHCSTKSHDDPVGDVKHHRADRCGRPRIDLAELRKAIRNIPVRKRMKRKLAAKTRISRSVIRSLLQAGSVRRHTNNVKPSLTAENKVDRVKFALSHVKKCDDGAHFDAMYDIAHIDEKWFNEDTYRKTYYLLDNEPDPLRRRKSKRFIGKTMFIAASRDLAILKCDGDNTYKLPHSKKDQLARKGELPDVIQKS